MLKWPSLKGKANGCNRKAEDEIKKIYKKQEANEIIEAAVTAATAAAATKQNVLSTQET